MRRLFLVILFFLLPRFVTFAGTHRLEGKVSDSSGPLSAISVSLLAPADSTLVAFGITDADGRFVISHVNNGAYVLQIASLGYYTAYRHLMVTDSTVDDLGSFTVEANKAAHLLNDVVISGERVPVRVKGDTLEYNASSFKVKPDAVVEDLLRKLPGIEVDKDGNIKSMGKNVKKVLVDGKEFFNDDPLLATKNLPANAIDKVQAFEKKSDGALFTGIDDGDREQTLNLSLKKNAKGSYFGDVAAGVGSNERYEGNAKVFKFRGNEQLAGLGMLNNVNKFGFSFKDYLNFNGGVGSLLQNGGEVVRDRDLPIDNGKPVSGAITSGAAALNYTIEPRAHNRLTFGYMGNGIRKFLDQNTLTQNYVPGNTFERTLHSLQNSNDIVNHLSLRWRNEVDSQNMYTMNLRGQLGNSEAAETGTTQTFVGGLPENFLNSYMNQRSIKTFMSGSLDWIRKINHKWPVFEARINADYSNRKDKKDWNNTTQYFTPAMQATDQQYVNNEQVTARAAADLSVVRSLGKSIYLVPDAGGAYEQQASNRTQGVPGGERVDSLSPGFYRNVITANAGLQLKRNLEKTQLQIALKMENMLVAPFLNGNGLYNRSYRYLLPSMNWRYDFRNGRSVMLNYSVAASAPEVAQMMPVADYSNPLMVTQGNINLKPEYRHTGFANYSMFDQFSMSSFFVTASGSYVRNSIGWSQITMPDLSQLMTAVNTPYALNTSVQATYATPIRKLGIKISAELTETWNKSIAPIDNVNNTNNVFTHKAALSFSNLNSDKVDLRWGIKAEVTNASFSVDKARDAVYYNYNGFIRCNYRPEKHWNISLTSDITHYTAQGFNKAVTIPICNAELTRYLLKNNRLSLNLRCFDLLNQNRAIYQTSQLNYLLQQRSNIIGRYVMCSVGYKLNKAKSGNANLL